MDNWSYLLAPVFDAYWSIPTPVDFGNQIAYHWNPWYSGGGAPQLGGGHQLQEVFADPISQAMSYLPGYSQEVTYLGGTDKDPRTEVDKSREFNLGPWKWDLGTQKSYLPYNPYVGEEHSNNDFDISFNHVIPYMDGHADQEEHREYQKLSAVPLDRDQPPVPYMGLGEI